MKKSRTAAAAVSLLLAAAASAGPAPLSGVYPLAADGAEYTCMDIDPLEYTYEIYPLLEPFNEYFYVRTDNPNPESFRFSDKESPYSETSVIYNVDTVYADVEYEDESVYRVPGGYIFRSSTTDGGKITLQVQQQITRAEFNTEVYGEPDPKSTGYSPYHGMPVGTYEEHIGNSMSYYIRGYYKWVDSDITFTLPSLCDSCDYLIKTYASGDDFFADMSAVQSGFSSICLYSGSFIRGELYRTGERGWHLTPGFHVDQSFYIYSPYSRRDNKSLFASALYPYRYDSLGFPGMMGKVSKRLSNESSYEWSSTSHAHIIVTYNGESKTYGGQGIGEGQGISADKLTHIFTFGSNNEAETLQEARTRLTEYANVSMEDDIPREDELTWANIYEVVGDGAWVDMGGSYTYLYQKDGRASFSDDEWGVGNRIYWGGSLGYCRDTWVDGRYISKTFIKGTALEDHPEAPVMLTEATVPVITECKRNWDSETGSYVYTSAEVEESVRRNVLFRYDKEQQVWKANVNWGDSSSSYSTFEALTGQGIIDSRYMDMLTLTREDVEKLISGGDTDKVPEKGYIYDGYSPQGTPFVKGDCNDDGEFNVADLVLMQKWLLGTNGADMGNWRNADMNYNLKLDIYDLCLMRRMFVEK